jgi:hypothetical protein
MEPIAADLVLPRGAGSADKMRSWSVNGRAAISNNALPVWPMVAENDSAPGEKGNTELMRGQMRLPTFKTTVGTGGLSS